MKKYTVEDIMALRPCDDYSEEFIRDLFDGRVALSPRDIANLQIPMNDVAWCLSRLIEGYYYVTSTIDYVFVSTIIARRMFCMIDLRYIECMVEYLEGVE